MKPDLDFSPRLLIVWIVGAVLTFAVSLYLMGSSSQHGEDRTGPSTFSRSAVGYAGVADVLQRLDIPVVRSRSDSLGKLTRGGVLVIAEPPAGGKIETIMRTLLKADTILLVLPKWDGKPSEQKSGWIAEATPRASSEIYWVLHLVAPKADMVQVDAATWTTNALNLTPNIKGPINLMHGDRLRPLIGSKDGMLLGELVNRTRKIWVLSDPDVMANHALALPGNAALAVAIIKRMRAGAGNVVFDETVHGFVSAPANPALLLFRFPFVMATIQAAIAIGLLLWATLGRFGAPQPAPPPLSAGRLGLLQNIAKLVEFTGHQEMMIRRYVVDTVRDVAAQLHAPRGLSTAALTGWLQPVGAARGVDTDCAALLAEAEALGEGRRRNAAILDSISPGYSSLEGGDH